MLEGDLEEFGVFDIDGIVFNRVVRVGKRGYCTFFCSIFCDGIEKNFTDDDIDDGSFNNKLDWSALKRSFECWNSWWRWSRILFW